MDPGRLERRTPTEWHIPLHGRMRVPGVIFASESLLRDMDEKVYEQVANVATLPGIEVASFAMPDAHWGYGFPIGGVAAFDESRGGVVSAGGVGFDISCGVRTLTTGLSADDVTPVQEELPDTLFGTVPAGLGKRSKSRLLIGPADLDDLLSGGARWAVESGLGNPADLTHIEERGVMAGADPDAVSTRAKERQLSEMGTLGSGNHYLEVQRVAEVYDRDVAAAFGLAENAVVISIHCGSRGLGHQIGTDYLRRMAIEAPKHGIDLPDRELACVPIQSPTGRAYLGAMRAAINCALANREIITDLVRKVMADVLPQADVKVLYDVSHNTCKVEEHLIGDKRKRLFVHRKGATRAFGPGHPDLPPDLRPVGQPVLIGGSMGTSSYVLVGTAKSMELSFGSSCHGAGRNLSRTQAAKKWTGRAVIAELEHRGISIRALSHRGVAEEAPGAYKDVRAVVDVAEAAGLSRKVAKLLPLACIKG